MNRKTLALSVLLLASVGAASAIAAGGGHRGMGDGWHRGGHGMGFGRHGGAGREHRGMMGLKSRDADNDGSVTLDEFLKPRMDRFTALDKSGDGQLDAGEMTAKLGQRAGQRMRIMMAALDSDGDGKVTKDEFAAGNRTFKGGMRGGRHGGGRHGWHRGSDRAMEDGAPPAAAPTGEPRGAEESTSPPAATAGDDGFRRGRGERRAERFARLDVNGDGVITMADFEAGAADRLAWAKKKRMHVLDKDRNGNVSREEFTSRAKQRFADADLDQDGRITSSDLPPHMAERWQKGPGGKGPGAR